MRVGGGWVVISVKSPSAASAATGGTACFCRSTRGAKKPGAQGGQGQICFLLFPATDTMSDGGCIKGSIYD